MRVDLTDPLQRVILARRAIGLIDLTDLADDQSGDGIDDLCRRAAEQRTAAVCVWPTHVARCAALLSPSGVRVATVVNFPTGDEPIEAVVDETRTAIDDGADEIDVVIPYRAFIAGDRTSTGEMVAAVASVTGAATLLKVILETGALVDDDLVRSATVVACDNGADFVKTSTGKIPIGATPEAARVMLGVIADFGRSGRTIGIKPSGGVRTVDDVATYLGLADEIMGERWASPSTFRIGASGLLDVLVEVVRAGSETT